MGEVLEPGCDDDMLKDLECPVCTRYMTPPIELCTRGHSICSDCRRNIQLCPLCSAEFKGGRNFMAENLARKIFIPCENRGIGCTKKILGSDIDSHKMSCAFRLYKCYAGINGSCRWTGQRSDILNHVTVDHDGPCMGAQGFSFQRKHYRCFLFSVHGEIFWFHSFIDPEKKSVIFCVQYIGLPERASEFSYSIDFKSKDERRRLFFKDVVKDDLRTFKSLIEAKECLEVNDVVAEYFKCDDTLYYDLNIVHLENSLDLS